MKQGRTSAPFSSFLGIPVFSHTLRSCSRLQPPQSRVFFGQLTDCPSSSSVTNMKICLPLTKPGKKMDVEELSDATHSDRLFSRTLEASRAAKARSPNENQGPPLCVRWLLRRSVTLELLQRLPYPSDRGKDSEFARSNRLWLNISLETCRCLFESVSRNR